MNKNTVIGITLIGLLLIGFSVFNARRRPTARELPLRTRVVSRHTGARMPILLLRRLITVARSSIIWKTIN